MSTTTTEAATETDTATTTEAGTALNESTEPIQLPDDHPLVKSLAAMKDQIKDLKAAKTKLDKIEASQQTETERLTARAETAEQRFADLQNRYHGLLKAQAITKAATEHRAIDVDVITALIADQVEVDDDGTVTGHDKAIRALAKAKPHLFNNTTAGARDAAATGTHQARATPAQLFADAFEGRV